MHCSNYSDIPLYCQLAYRKSSAINGKWLKIYQNVMNLKWRWPSQKVAIKRGLHCGEKANSVMHYSFQAYIISVQIFPTLEVNKCGYIAYIHKCMFCEKTHIANKVQLGNAIYPMRYQAYNGCTHNQPHIKRKHLIRSWPSLICIHEDIYMPCVSWDSTRLNISVTSEQLYHICKFRKLSADIHFITDASVWYI